MFFTIIVNYIAVFGDRYRHIDRIDHQLAIHDLKGDICKVFVRVREVFCLQFHIIGTGIRSADGIVATEGEVRLFVQVVIDADIVAAYSMFFSVIVDFIAMFGDRYRHIDRVDHQLAIFNNEGDRLEVVIRVREIGLCQFHVVGTGIRSADGSISTEGEVRLCIQLVIDRHVITADRMCLSVIVDHIAMFGDRYRHVDRINYKLAIHNIERYQCKVLILICEVFRLQLHVIASCIRSRDFIRSVKRKVFFCIQVAVNGYVITGNSVYSAVIVDFITMLGDRDCYIDRCDFLVTVSHVESYFREVRVRIHKLAFIQTHVIFSGIRL